MNTFYRLIMIINLMLIGGLSGCANSSKDALASQKTISAQTNLQDEAQHKKKVTGMYYLDEGSFDKLSIGLSSDQVVQYYGQPKQRSQEIRYEATGLYGQEWNYPLLGMTLYFSREDNKNGVPKLEGLKAVTPCTFKTEKNIRLGDSKQSVEEAYQNELDKEESTDDLLIVGSIYGGILFRMEKQQVVEIFFGAIAE